MNDKLFLPALQGYFGDWTYYSALMELKDVVARIGYARQIQANTKLGDLMQRALDDRGRSSDIADYLKDTNDRFFNSLVVGVHGGAPSWHPFGLSSTLPEHELGGVIERDQELVGYLELRGDEKLFALDGQHRLSGIKKALERGTQIGEEKLSVIFVHHKEGAAGLRRTRSLFISLNKRAVPVKKRDIIALDEVDLPAIITRQLLDEHPWFSKGQVDTERFGNALPRTAGAWTTIGNFYDMNKIIINSIVEGRTKEELRKAERNRLPDPRIDDYRNAVIDFYQRLSKLDPVLESVFKGKTIVETSRQARRGATPHVLFRPIGMKIFVKIAALLRRTHGLASTFKILKKIPVLLTERPFSETIWDPDRENMNSKGETLAFRLLQYMLDIKPADEKLRLDYADWKGMDRGQVRLPNRLT